VIGNAAVSSMLSVQRAPVIDDDERLESPRFRDNLRLQDAFHNRPSLTPKDNGVAVRLMQEALVESIGPMVKSTMPDGSLDGKWGPETIATVRKLQDRRGVRPLGGQEAGHKTLGALDGSAPQPSVDMTLTEFTSTLQKRWAVPTIRSGTYEEQATDMQGRKGAAKNALPRSDWSEFVLPARAPLYRDIVSAFERFASTMGGLAEVSELVFLKTAYELDSQTGKAVKKPEAGADFGLGHMHIYEGITSTNPMLYDRSVRGKTPFENPVDKHRATVRNITHELAHGLETAATKIVGGNAGPDPDMMNEYMRSVGWTPYRPGLGFQLFDGGDKEVRDALEAGLVPVGKPVINSFNFHESRWIEQPLTSYMTRSPDEDFAEAVMSFLNRPEALKARSPRRFDFIQQHKPRWVKNLRQPTAP
jgi:hypothetical protein